MVDIVFAETFMGGILKYNITSVVLVNNTAKTIDISVPVGMRWRILHAKQVNDDNVDRAADVNIFDVAAATNMLDTLIKANTLTKSGGRQDWPSDAHADADENNGRQPVILDGADPISSSPIIRFYWAAGGASAGSTDADGCVLIILEMRVV